MLRLLATPLASLRSIGASSPPEYGLLLNLADALTADLPAWDDSEGTIFLDDGNGNKRAASWSSAGFIVVNNGSTLEKYPPDWSDPPHTLATAYYVDSTGGDDGDAGTSEGTAWETIAKVNGETFSPGDEILFKSGETWTETLTIPSSGSSGNVIKFGAYDTGSKPIIDGENTRQYCMTTGSSSRSNLWFDNIDFNRAKTDAPSSLKEGGVFFEASSANITLTNCVVRNSLGTGLTVEGLCHNFRMKDCVIHDNDAWGVLTNSFTSGPTTGQVFAFCEFYGNADAPFGATGTEALVGISANSIVYGCYFHDNLTGDHILYRAWNEQESDAYFGAMRAHDNTLDTYHGTRSFSPIGMKGRGGRVYRNKVYSGSQWGMNASIAQADDGGTPFNLTYCHHNIVADIKGNTSANYGGLTLDNLAPNDPDGRGELNHWNNTIDDCAHGYTIGDHTMEVVGNTYRAKNNLVTNIDDRATDIRVVIATIEIDYNYYYNVQNRWRYDSADGNFAAWQGNGLDANGTDGADPLYASPSDTDPTTRDYSLGASSPAKSQGTDDVYLIGTDVNAWIGINFVPHATGPDAGAYQYLSGKTLDFSKYFLGLQSAGGVAQQIKLWEGTKDESEMQAMTS